VWRRVKGVFLFLQYAFLWLVSIAVIFVGYAMLSESSLDAHAVQKYSGQITDRKFGKSFVFTVSGASVPFTVYKANRDYRELEDALGIGDTVTVYFVKSRTASIQLYQVEKNGQIVVGKQLLEGQNRIGGFLALIAGIALLGAMSWEIKNKKFW
jgi:hypothetical protein